VVHGGGKTISEWIAQQGVRSQFVRGLRVTDAATLQVAVAVLTGLVNSNLVAEITRAGAPAVSVSGVSDGMFSAVILDPELGYVGRIEKTNPAPVQVIVDSGRVPVIGPASLNLEATSLTDQILNINADTAAGHLARALKADSLVFQTDVEGVLDMRGRVIPQMTTRQAVDLINSGVAGGGMIPKLEACIEALGGAKSAHIIDGRVRGALVRCAEGEAIGTRIV
jgi:acetylglutamate kinase